MTKPTKLPDTWAGPTEADEESVLQDLYGRPDKNGVYHAAAVMEPTGVAGMLSQARKWLGTGEPNSIQEWYRQRNGSAFNYNFPWCQASVTKWSYDSGNYDQVCPRGDRAYTVYGAQDGQYLGKWHTGTEDEIRRNCAPGAIVFFDWDGSNTTGRIDHVGVCEKNLGDGRLQTIEGNTADVCARRVRGAGVIVGFWNPAYKEAPKPEPAPQPVPVPTPLPTPVPWTEKLVQSLPTLQRDSTGASVCRAQHLLLAAGQKLPQWGPDGDFGAETQAAVKKFQSAAKVSQTGKVDQATWQKLLGV